MVNRRKDGGRGQLAAAGDAAAPLDKQQACRPTRHSSRLSLKNNVSPKIEPSSADSHAYAETNGVYQPQAKETVHEVAGAGKKNGTTFNSSQRSLRSRRGEEAELQRTNHEAGSEENEERRRSSRRNECNATALGSDKKSQREEEPTDQQDDDTDNMDMYSRVKRNRRKIKRDMYGIPLVEEEEKSTEDEETEEDGNTGTDDSDEEGEDEDEDDENDEQGEDEVQHGHNLRHLRGRSKSMDGAKYNLRRNKPRTKLYEATIERKTRHINYFKETPPERYKGSNEITFKSPAHRYRRRKKATHRTSSTSSSSSSSESEDERRFSRRKKKSMAKARQRCLPMNISAGDLTQNMKDRQRIGGSLADIDPMSVDRSVTFDSVGGLSQHIQSLKEMIVFPLLYPEVFERFKVAPPRGVLFHGPPGTGKTLVARALANECSTDEKKVAFFMRKGADCLSKWVGESERQLRLLFDQAYQVRPSIIFFDEIDGLAPVRSSRQDQIHSSIVSTLLALMDGLDSRGEVVVIGATNRIDSIDPALRRPGRFDREFLFSLPSAEARTEILRIHTKEWNPRLLDRFVLEVAAKCNGYCGADMKSLCTEAALHALRRRYPQIYSSSDKLQLDVTSINISAADFHHAMSKIVPAGQRAVAAPGRPLSMVIRPLLLSQLNTLVSLLNSTFPFIAHHQLSSGNTAGIVDSIEDNSNSACVTECSKSKRRSRQESDGVPFLDFSIAAYSNPIVSRPRLLIHDNHLEGSSTHLAPALLHYMEKIPIHVLDLPTLFANSARTAEESCAQVFREARRSTPSVIYIPHIDRWWQVLSHTMQATFLIMLEDMDPLLPILLLATADKPVQSLPAEIQELFSCRNSEVYAMRQPTEAEIKHFFEDLLLRQTCVPPPCKKPAARNLLEVLPKVPVVKPALTDAEEKALWDQEENVLRELRLFLRDMLNKLASDRKFNIFSKPVDVEEVPDYYDIITTPMDLSKMMAKIDLHQYQACREFLDDIDLICANALEYNPADSVAGRAVRHRACALKDTAHALIESELDEEFEKQCEAIMESRRSRGQTPSKSAPKYYHTKPQTTSGDSSMGQSSPIRYSRRLRREQAEQTDIHIREETGSTARVSHDITQDDLLSPPRKRRKRKLWSHGHISSAKKPKPKTVVEDNEENEEEGSSVNTADVEQQADVVPEHESVGADAKLDLSNRLDNCESSNDVSISTSLTNESVNVENVPVNGETTLNHCNDSSQAPTPNPTADAVLPEDGESKDTVAALCIEPESLVATKDCDMSSHVADREEQVAMETRDSPAISDTPVQVNGVSSPKPAEDPIAEISPSQVTASTSPIIKEKVMEMEPLLLPKRMTRSTAHDAQTTRCRDTVDVPTPAFIIDSSQLPALLDKAVSVGILCNAAGLEKLYSLLAQRIYHHRLSYERTDLLLELNGVLDSYVTDQTL